MTFITLYSTNAIVWVNWFRNLLIFKWVFFFPVGYFFPQLDFFSQLDIFFSWFGNIIMPKICLYQEFTKLLDKLGTYQSKVSYSFLKEGDRSKKKNLLIILKYLSLKISNLNLNLHLHLSIKSFFFQFIIIFFANFESKNTKFLYLFIFLDLLFTTLIRISRNLEIFENQFDFFGIWTLDINQVQNVSFSSNLE